MKNKIYNIAVLIISSVIFLYFFLYQNGFNQLISVLKEVNVFWLVATIFLMFIYFACIFI